MFLHDQKQVATAWKNCHSE